MRTIYFTTLFLLSSLVPARAFSRLDQDDNDLKIDGVDISFYGCDEINPKTKDRMSKDVVNAWDDAIAMANAVTEIDTGTDVGSFDFFGPEMQTEGMGYKILSFYNNLGSFGPNFFWGWRVNVFCPSEDEKLRCQYPKALVAFQWDTPCKYGRCTCYACDENGQCNKEGEGIFDVNPDNAYINIQFCATFFTLPSLKEAIDEGKRKPKEQKYNMNTYWWNRGRVLFHELLHSSTVGQNANEGFPIIDLTITIRTHDEPDEFKEVVAYGPLNAKMLARTVWHDNFRHVRQNDDNWCAYALARHIQKEVGVYPILPLADDQVYADDASMLPNALFLAKGDKTLVNSEIYNSDTLCKPEDCVPSPWVDREVVEGTTFRSTSDYPKWYIERLLKARNGDLDGTGPMPGQPGQSEQSDQPAHGPPKVGMTLEMFWEVQPGSEEKLASYLYWSEAGKGSDPCNTDPIDTQSDALKGKDSPIVIDGEWYCDLTGMGKCKFQGIGKVGPSGENGWLHCPNRPAIMCKPDERPIENRVSDTTVKEITISFCHW